MKPHQCLGLTPVLTPVSAYPTVTVAQPSSSVSHNVFVAQTPETYTYDSDGNLTSDGRWLYGWDAENRLTNMVSLTTVGPQQNIKFQYDWKGRRIHKQVWPNTAGTGTPTLDERYIYDGWNLIAVINSSSWLEKSFVWGLDLSGSMQGAGGVGGLLWLNDAVNSTTHFAGYDGNGNVISLLNPSNPSISGETLYAYGPFGELLRASGPEATTNPFRFSTKYTDDETDLLYYGYRYYNPIRGGFINRDPIEEKGGLNLYGFCGNDGINHVDRDGRIVIVIPVVYVLGAVIAGEAVIIYSELTEQRFVRSDLAVAISYNNLTMARLKKIIEDPDMNTFDSMGIIRGGTLGVTYKGPKCQQIINKFEKLGTVSGWKTGVQEVLTRIATDGEGPVPSEYQQTPEKRAELAKALLARQKAFSDWLEREYQRAK